MNISIPEERSTTKKRKELDTMNGTKDNFKEAELLSRERWQKQHPESIKVKKEYLEIRKDFLDMKDTKIALLKKNV